MLCFFGGLARRKDLPCSMAHALILLDNNIFFWVLLPLIYIMLVVGVVRHYFTLLIRSKPSMNDIPTNAKEKEVANYVRALLMNGTNISPEGYRSRVERLISEKGELRKKIEGQMNMFTDPTMMGDMMKGNIAMIVPQIAMMSLVSYFFSGFVIAKVPFPLTDRFKGMMQRGVEIDLLNVSYVASLSMYFLILFGAQGILRLVLGEYEGDESQMMQQQVGAMGMGGTSKMRGPQQPTDYAKVYKQLADDLEFSLDQYKYNLQDATQLLLKENQLATLPR